MSKDQVSMTLDEKVIQIIDLIAKSRNRSRSYICNEWLTDRAKMEERRIRAKEDT